MPASLTSGRLCIFYEAAPGNPYDHYPGTYAILMRLGGGVLNEGIEKAVEIAEGKQYNVKSELMKIADVILSDSVQVLI